MQNTMFVGGMPAGEKTKVRQKKYKGGKDKRRILHQNGVKRI